MGQPGHIELIVSPAIRRAMIAINDQKAFRALRSKWERLEVRARWCLAAHTLEAARESPDGGRTADNRYDGFTHHSPYAPEQGWPKCLESELSQEGMTLALMLDLPSELPSRRVNRATAVAASPLIPWRSHPGIAPLRNWLLVTVTFAVLGRDMRQCIPRTV